MRALLIAAAILASAPAMADSCWIVTQLQGKTAFASEGYEITDDGFKDAVFVVRMGSNPHVQVAGPPASYGAGQFFTINDQMLMYVDPHQTASSETWAIDPEKGVAYMTQMRAGFGPMNKAAMFIGAARRGC